jgi:hypothetical protein
MSRRGRTKPLKVQLFPFLDVLISTMGALIVLLHIFASQGQAEAKKVEAERAAAREAVEQDTDFFRWRAEHLREARDKTQAQLAEERLRLSHVEDHQRRLEEQLKQLQLAAAELEKAGASDKDEREKNAAELAQVKEKIAQTRTAIDAARTSGKHKAVNYSVVPFEGRNGTQRRPIYIECAENKIILQPEAVELTPADFIGYFGPGNPLASALRAQREYFARQAPGGQLDDEPYPLLLVRPEGIAAYYAARAALDSWGSEFGYELIGSDWKLKFPPADAKLAELTEQVVAEARTRQREYLLTSPEAVRRRPRPVYHAKSHGGFAPEPGTGDGPGGDSLGAWSGRGGWGSSGTDGDDSSGSGTARGSRGLAGEPGRGPGGSLDGGGFGYGSDLSQYAPDGVGGGGDPYSEPGTISPQAIGRRDSQYGSGIRGSGPYGDPAGDLEHGTGRAGSGDYVQRGPYSGTHAASNSGRYSAGGPRGAGDASSNQQPYGAYTGQPDGTGQAHGNSANGAQGNPGMVAAGSPGSARSPAGAMSPGDVAPGAEPQDINGMPSLSFGNATHPQVPQHAGGHKLPQSMAATRGTGWGLSESGSRAIGASRPILVQCHPDKLVIVPETRDQKPREIRLGERTQDAMDELVSGVWDHAKGWGTAGRGVFWKPTLVLDVAPGADMRFREIQALLDGSGLDVERRGQSQAKQQPARTAPRK